VSAGVREGGRARGSEREREREGGMEGVRDIFNVFNAIRFVFPLPEMLSGLYSPSMMNWRSTSQGSHQKKGTRASPDLPTDLNVLRGGPLVPPMLSSERHLPFRRCNTPQCPRLKGTSVLLNANGRCDQCQIWYSNGTSIGLIRREQ
jgi:hypothetical protein